MGAAGGKVVMGLGPHRLGSREDVAFRPAALSRAEAHDYSRGCGDEGLAGGVKGVCAPAEEWAFHSAVDLSW